MTPTDTTDDRTGGTEDADRATRFAFTADRLALLGLAFGVRAGHAVADATGPMLAIRFGPWSLTTPLANVSGATRTGPYRPWRVAGPARLSLGDRGVTFATTAAGGVCIEFRHPVRAIDPFGVIRHPNATVTVDRPDELVAILRAAAEASADDPDSAVSADPGRGTILGGLRSLVSWTRRGDSVRVEQRQVATVAAPPAATADRADEQGVEDGAGPRFHRTYRASVRGATIDAETAMAAVQADVNVLTDDDLAPFVKDRGAAGRMAVGDRYTVTLAGPWDGPVAVDEVQPTCFRLSTLGGHMESGLIEFRIETGDRPDELTMVIESWARSGDRFFDALYDSLGVAKALQSEMWVRACESFVALTGGEQVGPVAIDSERGRD